MLSVKEAEHIILRNTINTVTHNIPLQEATCRVLGEDIQADRDLPPYDRVAMDGIAVLHDAVKKGNKQFRIAGIQKAGDEPLAISNDDECIEIMTGAAMPGTADTIIRYEDVKIENGVAELLTDNITQGQNIHYKGSDVIKNQLLVEKEQIITPQILSIAASTGLTEIPVKKLPKVVIITTGDELVPIDKQPGPYEIRRSNNYTIASLLLEQYKLPADIYHIADDESAITGVLSDALQNYDVIILSGGVSMGKYDYVPTILERLHVKKMFNKVAQRPGKPFWFGINPDGKYIFAFPGNPVSAFLCAHRYLLPWMDKSMGLEERMPLYAALDADFSFKAPLQYFLQVKITVNIEGKLIATPNEGNGSGDFSNLAKSDAFMELPYEIKTFNKGDVFRIWPIKRIL